MEPGNKVADGQLPTLYREWGVFFTHKQKLDIATHYYNISLNLKDDPKVLYNRSRCKRNIAQTLEALCDAKAAVARDPLNQLFNLEVCDALYESNDFEQAKCEVFNISLKFTGIKLNAFHNRSDVLNDNFKATLNDALGFHMLENEKYIYKSQNPRTNDDERFLWETLNEQGNCDVLSIIEKEEELIFPREEAQQKLAFKNFNQIYMGRSWIDVLFIKSLISNSSLLLPQFIWSSPQLNNITQHKFDVATRFLRMLHARIPLYAQKVQKSQMKQFSEETKKHHLFHIQYQVHRSMLAVLRKIKHLRKMKKIQKLQLYIEEVMGDYVVLKTTRVMPWKYQFINEVYNLLALAHIERHVDVSINLTNLKPEDRFTLLLNMPKEKVQEPLIFVFGNKTTYQDEDTADSTLIKQKEFLTRMEKRLAFSKHSIEKCYLHYAIAQSHLKNSRFDECCTVARKGIAEAQKCNSLVWIILKLLLICKSHVALRKIEKIQQTLVEARNVAQCLKNGKIIGYIELLQVINEENAFEKKLQEDFRKTKSRQSMISSGYKNSSIASSI